MQVDDTLFADTSSFLKDEEAQDHRFLTKYFSPIGPDPVQFNATSFSKIGDGFLASQSAYFVAIMEA